MTVEATKLVKIAADTSPGANVDFGTITTAHPYTRLVVSVAVGTASKILVGFADGTMLALNGDVALAANTLYAFTIPVDPGEQVDFQLGTDVALKRFLVDGYPGGI